MPFVELSELNSREVLPGFTARFMHGENMTASFWDIEPDGDLPAHAHPHEQMTVLLEGEMDMTVGNETIRMVPGFAAVIPSNVEHYIHTFTKCRVMDIFYPVREDFK